MTNRRYLRLEPGERQRQLAISRGQEVANAPWFSPTVTVLSAWFVAAAHRIATWTDDARLLEPDESLRSELPQVVNMTPEVADRVLRWRPWHDPGQDDPEAAWVWGAALADAATQLTEQPPAISYVWQQIGYDPVSRQAFLSGLSNSLGSARGDAVRSFLRDIPSKVRDLTGCRLRLRESPEAIAAQGALWWAHATFHDCWDDAIRDYFVWDCPDVGLLQALCSHDKHEYLQALEETQNPVVVANCFTYVDVNDEYEVLGLLSSAPLVWRAPTADEPTGTWTYRFTAPLLLDAVVNHVVSLEHLITVYVPASDVTSERDALLGAELPHLCDRVVETLLVREDGVFLAVQFLAHLMHRLEAEAGRRPVPAITHVCDALARSLASHGITLDHFRMVCADVVRSPDAVPAAYKKRVSLPGRLPAIHDIDVILAIVAVSAASGAADAVTALLPAFTRSLLERDPGIAAARHLLPSPRHVYAATLFLWTPDPMHQWVTLWEMLAEQRLRALHSVYTFDGLAEDPSIFLINAGMRGLDLLCAHDDEAATVALRLWEALYDATLAVVVRQQRTPPGDHWRVAVAHLCGYLPVVLRQQPSTPPMAHVIGSALARLGGDDDLLIDSAATLHHTGTVPHDLIDAFGHAGVDLAEVLARHDASADTSPRVPQNMPETTVDIVRRILAQAPRDRVDG